MKLIVEYLKYEKNKLYNTVGKITKSNFKIPERRIMI